MKQLKTTSDLRSLQRLMGKAVMRPLTSQERMQPRWTDGRSTKKVASLFIKPNDRLSSFDRLEIYNRQYWFRVLDCFSQDFPGIRAILGDRKFELLAHAYLARYPSGSFTLRNLGRHIEEFLLKEPRWTAPHQQLALDMARFEWAQVIAFDGESREVLAPDDLLGKNSSKIKLRIQPYISFLKLNYPVDDFVLNLKKQSLRSEASNAVDHHSSSRKKVSKLPKREEIYVAVHRLENSLYYKRLDPEAFKILVELQKGQALERACTIAIGKKALHQPQWPERIRKWFRNWTSLGWFCK